MASCDQIQVDTWIAATGSFAQLGPRDAAQGLQLETWLKNEAFMPANQARVITYFAMGESESKAEKSASSDGLYAKLDDALEDLAHVCAEVVPKIERWNKQIEKKKEQLADKQAKQDVAKVATAAGKVATKAAEVAEKGATNIAENAGSIVVIGLVVVGLLLWRKTAAA